MTVKLYDDYPYEKEFDSVVTNTGEDKRGSYIILAQTLFFPEEGGQTPDKGTINGAEISHVAIRDGEILHYLCGRFCIGDKVHGVLDFEHRFSNMQLHSGEHIFSGLVHSHFGYNNVGFHLSDNSATMDYDGKLSYDDVCSLETEANRVIFLNKSIKAYYPSKEELASMKYRLKKELSGPIRIVIVEDTDVCACCAPHVSQTGEIGLLKIISVENYKGGTRINYLCGYRALLDYRKRVEDLAKISAVLSAKAGDEAKKVEELNCQLKEQTFENIALYHRLLETDIVSKRKETDNVIRFSGKDEVPHMRYAMDVLHKYYKGICAVFAGDEESGYRYLIESAADDILFIAQGLKDKFDAKGGGKAHSIQGSVFANRSDLELYLKEVIFC